MNEYEIIERRIELKRQLIAITEEEILDLEKTAATLATEKPVPDRPAA